jgi:quercetin dioxygenase-like cupin family protein
MPRQTVDLHVDPSGETIRLGPLTVRFLITGDDSTGSIVAFELFVPGAQRLAAPAHSHDHYEEAIYGLAGVLTWTVDGRQIEVGPVQSLCSLRGAIHRFDNHRAGDVKALCLITPAAIGPHWSSILPRGGRGDLRGGRRAAGPGQDDRDHDSPRPYAGSAPPQA